MLEETGLVVDVGPVIEVFDRIMPATSSTGSGYHFGLVDLLWLASGGTLYAGSEWMRAICGSVGARRVFVDRKGLVVIQLRLTLAREAPRPVR